MEAATTTPGLERDAMPRGKMAKSGMKPELRAEIPPALADWIADNYTRAYRSNDQAHAPATKDL